MKKLIFALLIFSPIFTFSSMLYYVSLGWAIFWTILNLIILMIGYLIYMLIDLNLNPKKYNLDNAKLKPFIRNGVLSERQFVDSDMF